MTQFRYDENSVLGVSHNALEDAIPCKFYTPQEIMAMRVERAKTHADMVNHPPHYKTGGIEAIDYIQAKLSPEEFAGYCKGNALKYISRAGHKGDAAEDTRKAIWYLERMLG